MRSTIRYCMTSVTAVACERLPLVPVMVSVLLPFGPPFCVVMVSVAVPDPLIEAGEKLADARAGNPPTVRFTAPVKLFTLPIVTV